MNTRALTSSRERRTGLLVTMAAAAAAVPFAPSWAALLLLVFVTVVLGKIAIEGRVAADTGIRLGKSLEATIKRIEVMQSDLVAGVEEIVATQTSTRRDLDSLAPLGDELDSVQRSLTTELDSLSRAHAEFSRALGTLQRRQERLEAMLTTSRDSGSKRTRLGRGLDGTPESQLADAISQLNQAIVGK